MTNFIFVRHGKSQDNQDDLVSRPDTPLTKEGEGQAREVARQLRNKHVAVIAASPFPRAQQTAQIIAKELKIDTVQTIDDLRERGLGQFEGHKHEHEHTWYHTVEGQGDVEPRGVVIARCESALATIKKLSAQGMVLVVGHTIAGYYLRQVASGKRRVDEFAPPSD